MVVGDWCIPRYTLLCQLAQFKHKNSYTGIWILSVTHSKRFGLCADEIKTHWSFLSVYSANASVNYFAYNDITISIYNTWVFTLIPCVQDRVSYGLPLGNHYDIVLPANTKLIYGYEIQHSIRQLVPRHVIVNLILWKSSNIMSMRFKCNVLRLYKNKNISFSIHTNLTESFKRIKHIKQLFYHCRPSEMHVYITHECLYY